MKGPKAILSSAIANALGEYFIVDANTIESNLLKDAKIVLRRVKLQEKVTRIPINSAGKSTSIAITGSVDEVAFTWAWSVGDVMWVNDAVLTIVGAKFQAKFEHEERIVDEDATAPDGGDNDKNLRESFVNPETIDEASAKKIKEQKGGLGGFVAKQVKMAIDMLTLKMVDFELRLVLPHPLQPLQQQDEVGVSSAAACHKVLVVGIDKYEVLSFGRGGQGLGVAAEAPSKLKQKINLNAFACGINIEGSENNEQITSYPLVDSFSYSADVTRLGERFGGFLTGLEVSGLGQPADLCPNLAPVTESGLSVHMGSVQIETLMQLSVMVLALPDDSTKSSEEKLEELSSESSGYLSDTTDPSSFTFPLSSASLVLFEDKRFVASCINMRYKADGTVCILEAAKMEYESDAKSRASASQIVISMRPRMKMTIGCIESLCIPDSFLLSNPIQAEFYYEGNTLRAQVADTMDVITFNKKPDEAAPQTSSVICAPYLPVNIDLCLRKGMQLKKAEDGSLTKFGRFHLYALKGESYTKIAIQFESFRNYLFSANTVSFCGSLPLDQVDTVNDFIFTAGDAKIVSGHSTEEWTDAFHPRKQKVKKDKQSTKGKSIKQSTSVIKLPFANISSLNVVIGLGASRNVGRVKDTSLVIKPFEGKAETTSKDLISYYTKACLSRVPNFVSNAEVLGLNIVDSTTGLWATWAGAGLGLGSAFGAGTGVAAITAVDAIKGAVDAGKRSRNVSEGAEWKPGDFVRGLVQAAGEATRDGVVMRGKQGDGNIIDWTVGATSNTADYVVENKNRLGAAGAGGGGFLLGMALGGPIGAIVGGLVATATTGVALETLDEKGKELLIKDSNENSKKKTGKSKTKSKTSK